MTHRAFTWDEPGGADGEIEVRSLDRRDGRDEPLWAGALAFTSGCAERVSGVALCI